MTKKHDSNEKYAYLYKLSHEKLMELLLSAPIPAATPEDETYIDALEEAILKKENETPTGLIPDVDQQWLEFQNYYCSNENTADSDAFDLPPVQKSPSISPKDKSVSRGKRHLLRRTLAIAAIITLLMALTVPVALGYTNVFEMIGYWTDDYFHFVPTHEETVPSNTSFSTSVPPTAEFDTPQEALNAYGITQKILPSWFPKGFSFSGSEIYTLNAVDQNMFSFTYSNADSVIILSFTQHMDNSINSGEYQKNAGPVEEYQVAGILYYLYTNAGQTCASWCVDNMECSIYGDISMDDLKEMVNSIEV